LLIILKNNIEKIIIYFGFQVFYLIFATCNLCWHKNNYDAQNYDVIELLIFCQQCFSLPERKTK